MIAAGGLAPRHQIRSSIHSRGRASWPAPALPYPRLLVAPQENVTNSMTIEMMALMVAQMMDATMMLIVMATMVMAILVGHEMLMLLPMATMTLLMMMTSMMTMVFMTNTAATTTMRRRTGENPGCIRFHRSVHGRLSSA
eukprot:313180-Pyramimonas_sp.AAC.1